jgi:hypothetical protein
MQYLAAAGHQRLAALHLHSLDHSLDLRQECAAQHLLLEEPL